MSAASEQALERASRRRVTLWIGAAGAGLVTLVGMFGYHDASVWRLPLVLQGRAEAALAAAGLPGVEVDMRGQAIELHGVAGSPSATTIAHDAALTSSGPGGAWAGGVTQVNARGVRVGDIEQPFSWRIERTPARVTLSGAVPSMSTRALLAAVAHETFPNATPIDAMHVAGGAPSAHWRDAAVGVVRALKDFDQAQAEIADRDVNFTVAGPANAIADLRQRTQTLQAPFRAHIEASPSP